jgi:raffinose/stachyose/melibiose transport system substrate-binding protein
MVPVSINFVGVYYNKTLFEKNGITTIPKTRAEFYAVCDKLKAAGVQVLQVTDKEQWTIGHGGTVIMENMFDTSKLLEVINTDLSVADVKGFDVYMDWLEKSRKEYAQADFLGTAYEAGLGDFANGKGAMLMQGNWIIPVLKKTNPDFKFGVFVFPAENAANTKPHWGIDYTLCLNGAQKDNAKDAAGRAFLDYFINTGAQIWADQDGSVSCIDGVKSGIPEYEPVSSMVLSGNAYAGWFSDTWPAGCYDQFNIAQQNFLTNFDRAAFIKELDITFKEFKGK